MATAKETTPIIPQHRAKEKKFIDEANTVFRNMRLYGVAGAVACVILAFVFHMF